MKPTPAFPTRLRQLLVLVSGAFSLALAAAEPDHGPAHDAASPAPHAAQAAPAELGAQAAFDAHGALWAVHKISGHIAVSRSSDLGQSWSNPVLVTPAPEPTDPGGDARPKIALGPRGEIYLTWTRPLAQPYTGEIRFTRSLDGGRTFAAPITVHRDRQVITHRFDAVAVNSDGQVFVGWLDKRDLVAAGKTGPGSHGAALYFAVSDDRGATFRGDFKVAESTCECCRIALAAQPDGRVRAVWRHIFPANIRDHATAELSADGTATPLRRISFENWAIDACPHHGPALAIDATGCPHAVWFSGAPEKRGVFYGRCRPDSIEGLRRIGAENAARPDVAVSGERVAIGWKTFAHERTQLHGLLSDDGGNTWREFHLASAAGTTDHPRVLAHSGAFHVFWNTQETPLRVVPFPP